MKNESKDNDFMLTTFDNPFNPFTDFESWHKQDMILGHDCCGLLATYAAVSPAFGDEATERDIDDAMDAIVSSDPLMYRKVTRDMEIVPLSDDSETIQ